jgi:hypothetical protein
MHSLIVFHGPARMTSWFQNEVLPIGGSIVIRSFRLVMLFAFLLSMPIFAATLCVNPGGGGGCSSSIQGAINAANPGDTVLVQDGVYVENIIVNKSITLAGEHTDRVVIRPSLSYPTGPGCSGSLCTGASNVILVEASDVTIHHLTIDGDNPLLQSGVVAGGADLDARNGIITNHNLIGQFDNLEIHHVTVKNTYLRGIYASSGGTFNFHDNSVANVQAEYASICMFNFGGSGIMARNHVSDCNDAISSNWSGGVQFLDNEIEHSGSGVHTDNAGGFGTLSTDLIRGNKISKGMPNAYGIFVFVPYVPVRVENNNVEGMTVGLSVFGAAANVTTVFSGNTVDGKKVAGSVGAFVTTDELSYGAAAVSVDFENNSFTANTEGIQVQGTGGMTATVTGACNSVRRNSAVGIHSILDLGVNNITLTSGNIAQNGIGAKNDTPSPIQADHNWWGCSAGPGHPGCDSVTGAVTFSPDLALPSKCALGGKDN